MIGLGKDGMRRIMTYVDVLLGSRKTWKTDECVHEREGKIGKLLMSFSLAHAKTGREIDECMHERETEKKLLLDSIGCILGLLASIGRGRFSAYVSFLFIVSLFSFGVCLFRFYDEVST